MNGGILAASKKSPNTKKTKMGFYQQYKTLTMIDDFDASKIVFDKPRDEEVGGNKHIKGKRIRIGYMNPEGRVCELIIPTEKLYAHQGVIGRTPYDKKTEDIIGYDLPISLYKRDGDPSGRDRKFVSIFRQIIDTTKDHVVEVKKQIGQAHLEKVMLYKWDNMLYEKKDEAGEPVNDFGPTLYAKLMYMRERNALLTKLVDKHGQPLELDDVVNKPCDVIACVKFESIYVNANGCSLQVKVAEAILDMRDAAPNDNLLLSKFIQPSAKIEAPEVSTSTTSIDVNGDDDEMLTEADDMMAQPAVVGAAELISDASDYEDGGPTPPMSPPATPPPPAAAVPTAPTAPTKKRPAVRKMSVAAK